MLDLPSKERGEYSGRLAAKVVDAPTDVASITVLRLRLIGQMEAWSVSGENVLPPGRKTRALLAIIALSAPRAISRARLADLLWSTRPEELARASLRQEIHRLLEHLGPIASATLNVTRDTMALRPHAAWIDVQELARASPADPPPVFAAEDRLLDDLGDIDPAFDAWLGRERDRVREAARALAEAALGQSTRPADIVLSARRLLAADGMHEGAWRALIRAQMDLGERGQAIQAAERCRIALREGLGASPSAETARCIAEVRGDAPLAAPEPDAADQGRARAVPLREGIRIAVLPLAIAGTPAQSHAHGHLGQSLADEITGALARLRWMFVLSSQSAAAAKENRAEQDVAALFGLTYLLGGSIQVMGKLLRVTLRLVDYRAGAQVVWTRRFDHPADDLIGLQDEIASAVVAQIDPEILLIEAAHAVSVPPIINPTAYDLLLRAMPLIARTDRCVFEEAGTLLRQAVAAEPDFAAGHAWLAYWSVFLTAQGFVADIRPVLEAAQFHAERALALDPFDARALLTLGYTRARLDRRLRDAIALQDRALALNPNFAQAWSMSALAHSYLGDLAEAERRVRRYKHLSPMDPHAFFFDVAFANIGVQKRDYRLTLDAARAISVTHPDFPFMLRPYIAALGHAGEIREAEMAVGRLLRADPHFRVAHFVTTSPFARAEDTTHFAEGMQRAGLG